MKQAILITAYKNADQLSDIINWFDDDFVFYVHIDKKSKIDLNPVMKIKNREIHIYNEYEVKWGGFNHLKAILFLSQKALENKSVVFFHAISGQDYPVKPITYFKEQLDLSRNYIEYFDLPHEQWVGGGMNRFDYYNFYDLLDGKKYGYLIILLSKIQNVLKLKRPYPIGFPKLYGGGTWWSLTRVALQYVMDYTDDCPFFFNRMKYTFCAEEVFFQTILLNSPLVGEIVNDDLRYIDWVSGRGGRPAFLDESDFSKIVSSENLFARKFDPVISKELKMIIDSYR